MHLHFTHFEETSEFRTDFNEATLEPPPPQSLPRINPLSPIHPLSHSSPV